MLPRKTDSDILANAPEGISEAAKAAFLTEERRQYASDSVVQAANKVKVHLDPRQDWGNAKSFVSNVKPKSQPAPSYGTDPVTRVVEPFVRGIGPRVKRAFQSTVDDSMDWLNSSVLQPWLTGIPKSEIDRANNAQLGPFLVTQTPGPTNAPIGPPKVLSSRPSSNFFQSEPLGPGFTDWLSSVKTVGDTLITGASVAGPAIMVGVVKKAWDVAHLPAAVSDINTKLDALQLANNDNSVVNNTDGDGSTRVDDPPEPLGGTEPFVPEVTPPTIPPVSTPDVVTPPGLTWADLEAAFLKGVATGSGRVAVQKVLEPEMTSPLRSDSSFGGGAARSNIEPRSRKPFNKKKRKRQTQSFNKRESPSDHKLDKVTSRAGAASQEMSGPVGKERTK